MGGLELNRFQFHGRAGSDILIYLGQVMANPIISSDLDKPNKSTPKSPRKRQGPSVQQITDLDTCDHAKLKSNSQNNYIYHPNSSNSNCHRKESGPSEGQ